MMLTHYHGQLFNSSELGISLGISHTLEQIILSLEINAEDCYFWATHNQAELDLMVFKEGKCLGFEFKYQDAPKLTPSMKTALEYLKLDQLTVIYPGKKDYLLAQEVQVIGLASALTK
jgi:predicted AAA+ superfamily ATPase